MFFPRPEVDPAISAIVQIQFNRADKIEYQDIFVGYLFSL